MSNRVFRVCLRAYPSSVRERDGRVIIDLASDLSTQGSIALLREATGLVLGGIRIRGRLLWRNLVSAPWMAACHRLALPLAVAEFCLALVFVIASPGPRLGRWASLLLGTTAVTLASVGCARRFPAIAGALATALLVLFAELRELSTHTARWMGNVAIGEVSVFAMWLPAVVLLVFCAAAIQPGERRDRSWTTYAVCLPIIVVIFLVLALRPFSTDLVKSALGGVSVYAVAGLAAIGEWQESYARVQSQELPPSYYWGQVTFRGRGLWL